MYIAHYLFYIGTKYNKFSQMYSIVNLFCVEKKSNYIVIGILINIV